MSTMYDKGFSVERNQIAGFRVLHIGTSIRVSKASFDAWLARIEEA